jgi:hypothetical protein
MRRTRIDTDARFLRDSHCCPPEPKLDSDEVIRVAGDDPGCNCGLSSTGVRSLGLCTRWLNGSGAVCGRVSNRCRNQSSRSSSQDGAPRSRHRPVGSRLTTTNAGPDLARVTFIFSDAAVALLLDCIASLGRTREQGDCVFEFAAASLHRCSSNNRVVYSDKYIFVPAIALHDKSMHEFLLPDLAGRHRSSVLEHYTSRTVRRSPIQPGEYQRIWLVKRRSESLGQVMQDPWFAHVNPRLLNRVGDTEVYLVALSGESSSGRAP